MENLNETIDKNYFYYFPNNFGGMTILYIAFRIASWIGFTDYYAIAMNGLLATLAILLTILICKNLFGVNKSIWVLSLFLLSPSFYTFAPVFYTDSLSLIFPVLTFYLYLQYTGSTTNKKKLAWAILIGLAVAIGALVKFTVIIVLFAIIIYEICSKRLKAALLLTYAVD
ncbi:MAG: glycosyltransferase family 39 protein [Clostridia bacterium]|nr:glycosyltransferase family 39 protein [Clostridia bacterium]MDD4680385.1 glycosyltransferase family 39 protein [Clostridia bacterium]